MKLLTYELTKNKISYHRKKIAVKKYSEHITIQKVRLYNPLDPIYFTCSISIPPQKKTTKKTKKPARFKNRTLT